MQAPAAGAGQAQGCPENQSSYLLGWDTDKSIGILYLYKGNTLRKMEKDQQDKLQLTSREMYELGHKIIDIIVEHYQQQDQEKLKPQKSRREMDALLQQDLPEEASPVMRVLEEVMEKVIPNSNNVSHPRSFSFVPSPSNFVSVMADALATGFNIFSGGWAASAAAAELEIICMNWLLQLFGFPTASGGGLFTSGGSMANLTALTTARNIKCGDDFSKAVVYLSDQAHSSNIKALRTIGFKKEQIKIIPSDLNFEMSIHKLKNEIAKDRLMGYTPFCIVATAGTTNTGTVDPLNEIALLCQKEDLWFHIDAAYGGAAILSEKGKAMMSGIEKADSVTVDPHKWLFQPYEIGCLLVKNYKWLSQTFTEKPEYLKDIEGNESEINFYDYGIQLTRRFRALKFYMSFKTFGLQAFRKAISYNIDLAESLENYLRKSPRWEVIAPASLGVINFRYHPISASCSEEALDHINQEISRQINASGEAFMVTTALHKKTVLRMCLINPRTTFQDLTDTIELANRIADAIEIKG